VVMTSQNEQKSSKPLRFTALKVLLFI